MPSPATGAEVLLVRAGTLAQQQHITTLCNYLTSEGLGVTLVSVNNATEVERVTDLDERVVLETIPFADSKTLQGVASRLRAAAQLRLALSRRPFDVLYVIDSWTLPFVWLATLGTFRWRKRPLAYHTFDALERGIHSEVHIALERNVCREADLVVNTDRARARLQQTLYGLKHMPLCIRNSLLRQSSLPVRDECLRRELLTSDAPADAVLLVYPTLAGTERLTLELLRAFTHLPDRYRLFTIVAENAYGHRCRQEVKSLGLNERVVLHPPMPHARLAEIAACADIGAIFHHPWVSNGNFQCSPSRLPLLVALGVPFVGTNVPNLEADVYRYDLGLCCDPFNADETARAIRSLAEDPPGLAARRDHLRQVFASDLYYEKGAGALRDGLIELARPHRGQP